MQKERFISYPTASPNSDDSLLLGWAGWGYREQALALITLIEERSSADGWGVEKLTPLLAGLLEVMPWVRQWHNEVDPVFGASPAYEYDTYLTSQREKYGLTENDLRAWTPPAPRAPAAGRRGMTEVLLRDLVAIPDEVHAGDFVLTLAKGVGEKSTITDYVVTEQLAASFDQALGLIKSAVETGASRAAYLDGSFGSGKSHFMAVLHAILRGDPDARGKKGLADVVAKHDPWLRGRKFLLVPYHLPDSQSLDAAILGGYVAHVSKLHPGTAAARRLPRRRADRGRARAAGQRMGDEKFIAQLPAAADEEWGAAWDTATLDEAFAEPPGGKERRRLVGDLLAGPFQRYARAVRADQESYISLDEGLSVISKHARDVLGYDAVVLLLDELVLWLAGYIGDPTRSASEAQKVSKLVESAEHERPAPIISFVPRQRDLRDLVGKDSRGRERHQPVRHAQVLGRPVRPDPRSTTRTCPAIVHERLLKPKDADAKAALDDAFAQAASVPAAGLGDPARRARRARATGRRSASPTRSARRSCTPWSTSPARCSGERTALKLMQQLLVDYRDTLPVGQLMPLGAIFDVLAARRRPAVHRQAARRVRARPSASTPPGPAVPAEQARPDRGPGRELRPTARVPRRRPGRQDAAARRAGAERARAARPDRDPPGRAQPRLDRDHAAQPGTRPGRQDAQGAQRGSSARSGCPAARTTRGSTWP